MNESSSAKEASSFAVLLVEAGLVALFLTSVVFLAGWSYADQYFALLGLSLSAIDGVEEQSFYAFSLWVFRDLWLVVFCAIAALAGVWALFRGRLFGRMPMPLQAVLIGLAAVLFLFGAGYLGKLRARDQVHVLFSERYQTFPRLRVVARDETELAAMFAARSDLGESTCLRKIFMDRNYLYAYAGYASLREALPNVLVLPLEDIAYIEILTNPDLCAP